MNKFIFNNKINWNLLFWLSKSQSSPFSFGWNVFMQAICSAFNIQKRVYMITSLFIFMLSFSYMKAQMPIITTQQGYPNGQSLSGIAYGNSTYIVGLNNPTALLGSLYTSTNGTTWSKIESATIPTDMYFSGGGAYGNGVFVFAGNAGKIITSSDNGATWTTRTSGTNFSLIDIHFLNGAFYAVGSEFTGTSNMYNNVVLSSTDGITWTKVLEVLNSTQNFNSIAYGGGAYVLAYTISGSGGILIYRSTTGASGSWTSQSIDVLDSGTNGVDFAKDRFFIFGVGSNVYTSTNGSVWTNITSNTINLPNGSTSTFTGGANQFSHAVSDGTTYYLFGTHQYYNSTGIVPAPSANGVVITSTDATTFTLQPKSVSASVTEAAYLSGKYFMITSSGPLYSTDGINYSYPSGSFYGLVSNGAGYALVGQGSTNEGVVFNSTNFSSFSQAAALQNTSRTLLTAIIYDGSKYVAVGQGGTVATSVNGITWTVGNTGDVTDNLNSIAYGNGVYVAVGNQGTILRSTNGTSWSQISRDASSGSNYNSVRYLNGRFIAVGGGTNITSGIGRVSYSTDGQTWTTNSYTPTATFQDIAYDGTNYLLIGRIHSATAANRVFFSTTTTDITSSSLFTSNVFVPTTSTGGIALGNVGQGALAYTNGNFVAAVNQQATPFNAYVLVSNNGGTSWSAYDVGTTSRLRGAFAESNKVRIVGVNDVKVTVEVFSSSSTPTVNLSVSSNTGTEAASTSITVTATASAAVSSAQTVNVAVTGTGITAGDYTLSNTTITIPNGQTTGSVTFTVVDDALVEGTETATLTISSPSSGITLGSTTTQNIAITDNDVACITPTAYTVTGTGAYCSGGSGVAVGLSNSETGVTYQLKNGATDVGSAVSGTTGNAISFGTQTAGTYTVVATRTSGGCTATMTGSAVVTDRTISNTGVNLLACPVSAKQTTTISNYTVPAGNNRLLVVTASDGLATTVSGVTFNGQAMIKQSQKTDGTAVDAIFTLVLGSSASSITGNIVMTTGNAGNNAAKFITASSFYNVDQTTPVSGFMQAQNTTNPSASSLTVSSAVGDMVFSIFDTWKNTAPTTLHTAGTGMIVQNTDNFSFGTGQGFGIYSTALKVGASTVTTGWSTTNHEALIEIAFNIKQAVSCTTPTTYTVTGTGAYCAGGAGVAVGLSNSETGVTYQLKDGSNANVGSPVNGSTGNAISFGNQTAGTYTVVATRTSGGCTATMTGNAVVSVSALPTANIAVTNNCGNSILNLTTNGTSFLWSNGATIEDITVSTAGTYTVTVSNASGCTATVSGTAAPKATPIIYNVTGGGVYCPNNDVSINISGTEVDVEYTIFKDGIQTNKGLLGDGLAQTFLASEFAPDVEGVYTIQVIYTTNGCTAEMTGSATVTLGTAPAIYNITGGGSICPNGTAPIGLASSELNTSYQLYFDDVATNIIKQGTGSALDFGNFSAQGVYNIKATSASGCTVDMQGAPGVLGIDIVQFSTVTPSVTITANPGSTIISGTSVTFTATPTNGGSTPSYQWKKNGNNVGLNQNTYIDAGLVNGDVITCEMTSNLTCATTATATSTGITMSVNVAPKNGLNFDGTDDYVSLPDATSLDLTNTFTLESWVYPTAYQTTDAPNYGVEGIISKNRAPSNTGYSLSLVEGKPSLLMNDGINNIGAIAPILVPLNMWSHVAATYDGVTIRLYLNGTEVFTQVPADIDPNFAGFTLNDSSEPLYIGGTGAGITTSPWLFIGSIDEAKVWNTVRTPSQLADNYSCEMTGSESGLVAYYKFNQGTAGGTNASETTLIDATAYANTGTLNNFSLSGSTSNWVSSIAPPLAVPSVNIVANPSGAIITGTNVTFNAIPANGGSTPSYQWKKNGNNVGLNQNTYSDNSLVNGDVITCEMISNANCVTTNNATSNSITMSVCITAPTTYAVTGGSSSLLLGGPPVDITLSDSDVNVTYQLLKDGSNFGTSVQGTGNALVFSTNQIGTYTVVATNSTGCTTMMSGSAIVEIRYCVTSEDGLTQISLSYSPTFDSYEGTNFESMYFVSWNSPQFWVLRRDYDFFYINNATSGTPPIGQWIFDTSSGGSPILGNTITVNEGLCVPPCIPPTTYAVTGSGSYCSGGREVGLSNSDTGVTYQLKNGTTDVGSPVNGSTGNAISFGSQTAGTYTVVATRTSGGCTAMMTGSAVVSVNTLPTASISVTDNCGNSVLNLTTNGTSFLWSNGATTEDITVSTAGTYTVTATTTDGCTTTASEIAAPKTVPIANAGADVTLSCASPSTTLMATGGVTYVWDNSATQGGSVSPTVTTTYTVTVTAANGCTVTDDVTITANPIAVCLSAVLSGTQAGCPNVPANLTVDVTGGTAPYTVVLNNGISDITVSSYQSGANIPVTSTTTTTYTLSSIKDATNIMGNVSGTATVTIDNIAPMFTNAPAELTVSQDSIPAFAAHTFTATDNVSAVTITNIGETQTNLAKPSCFITYYRLNRVYQVSDACGNTATATQSILVGDQVLMTCPSDKTLNTNNDGVDDFNCSTLALATNQVSPTYSDVCSNSFLSFSLSGASTGSGSGSIAGARFNEGVTQVRYTSSLNGTTIRRGCVFNVTVVDNELPRISVATNNIILTTCDYPTTLPNKPIESENCGTATLSIQSEETVSLLSTCKTALPTKKYSSRKTITWKVTDEDGRSNTATQIFYLLDNVAPTALCKSDVTVSVGTSNVTVSPSVLNNMSTDNCSGDLTFQACNTSATCTSFSPTLTFSRTMLGVSTSKSIPVVLRVMDGCGNSSTCPTNVLLRRATAMTGSEATGVSSEFVSEADVTAPMEESTVSAVHGNLKCYPNPFMEELNLSYNLSKDVERVVLKLYNMQGQVVETSERGEGLAGYYQMRWNLSHLPSGTYHVCLELEGKCVKMERVIMMK